MGKAFVAKLAKQGARDPEALAAWIGRQKFGRKAFAKLAKAGRERAEERQELMGRVRPGGRLADDLTGFGDEELGQALSDLTPAEALRVAAEMDRRDTATRLPGVNPALVGLSDRQLGERARDASGEELAAIAAEADRRQMLAETFPGGTLTDDLTGMDEDRLGWAVQYATGAEAERIAAEFDRRYPPAPTPAAAASGTAGGLLADRAALDNALAPMGDPGQWPSLDPEPPDTRTATERWIAEQEQAQASARAAYTREQTREMYREHAYRQWLAAENATRGVLLSRRAEADGVDPQSLFTGPAHIAYARASEELKLWWADNGRLTLAEFTEQVTGTRTAAGETARQARQTQQGRL